MNRRGFLSLLGKAAIGAVAAMPLLEALQPVNITVPMAWSSGPLEVDKLALVRKLLEDGIRAHDELIEQAIFRSTTDDFRRLPCWLEGSDRAAA